LRVEGTTTGRRGALVPILVLAAYGLLLVAWSIGNPPFAGPDESAHYERAIGVGQGQLIGPKASIPIPAIAPSDVARMDQWVADATRTVRVRGGLLLPDPACNAQQSTKSAACLLGQSPIPDPSLVLTPVGNYQPEAYLLPGWLLLRADNPSTADQLGRLAGALICLILLAVAVTLLWTGDVVSLLGTLVAVTPMVVFVNAQINPSGLEIASSVTFLSAMLVLSRAGQPARWVWWAAAASGAVLALSRSLGPVWLVIGVGVLLGLLGLNGAANLFRQNRIPAAICVLALVGAVVANRIWEGAYGSHLRLTASGLRHQLGPALHQLPNLLRQEIGDFGSLDSPLALPFVAGWLLLTLGLVGVALYVGSRRERLVMAIATILSPVIAVLFYAAFYAGSGFAAQGRHLLPAGVLVPLLAGEIVLRNRQRLSQHALRRTAIGVPLFVGCVQAAAWYGNARRQAVGVHGPLWFIPHADWQPPLGWWTWTAVVLAAAALFAVLSGQLVMSLRSKRSQAIAKNTAA
jgi:hypothetical protein